MRLKSARKRFSAASRSTIGICMSSMPIAALARGFACAKAISAPAMTTFTAGPAIAMGNSSHGSSGMRSSCATPPIGSNVTYGRHAESPRGEDVPEFVQQHAQEQEHHEERAVPGYCRAARCIVRNKDPREKQHERDVQAHHGASYFSDVQ